MISYLEQLERVLEEALEKATEGSLTAAPAGKWSAAQILEHLLLTYTGTNRGLAKCRELGVPSATRVTLKGRLATWLVVDFGYMPAGRRAPERTKPQGMGPEQVRRAIFPELQTMKAGLDDCEQRLGAATKLMDHPILGPLTAAEWRKFHWVHGKHHARQIRERMGKL